MGSTHAFSFSLSRGILYFSSSAHVTMCTYAPVETCQGIRTSVLTYYIHMSNPPSTHSPLPPSPPHCHPLTHTHTCTCARARTRCCCSRYCCGNTSSPLYADLLSRWFQFGAFCGIMRVHGYRVPTLHPTECDGPLELGMGPPGGHTEVCVVAPAR